MVLLKLLVRPIKFIGQSLYCSPSKLPQVTAML